MKVTRIARAFNMSAEQFAKHTGYTRQSLYSEAIKKTAKAEAAIYRLKELNNKILQLDQEEAKRRYEDRLQAIEEFEQHIQKGAKNDD